jgi:hypothetical protein
LPAETGGVQERALGVGASQWQIDINDLRMIPGVQPDPAVLAQLEIIKATMRTGSNVLERVERLEQLVDALKAEMRRQLETLRAGKKDHRIVRQGDDKA